MKVFFVSNTSWYLYNFRLALMDTLKKKGFEVVFCAPYDNYTENLKQIGFRFILVNIDRRGRNPFKDIKVIFYLYSIYSMEKPDLVLHYTPKINIYGAIAAKLAKVKCLNTVTGLGSAFIKEGLLSKFVKILYKISLKFSEIIFFQNKEDLKLFFENRIVSKGKTILVKGSGVNARHFDPDFCRELKKNDNHFVFLFFGRLLRDKGIQEFVSASKLAKQKYPCVEFCLLGPFDKGNPSVISEEFIRKWEKEGVIKYLGETDDVRPFICQSDVVVLPSYYREGIPRSLLEAMAMGKPIITTNTVGCKEVVEEDKNGLLVPIKDYISLTDAMIKLIELTPKERERMGSYSREKVMNEFSEDIVINTYLRTIERILDNNN